MGGRTETGLHLADQCCGAPPRRTTTLNQRHPFIGRIPIVETCNRKLQNRTVEYLTEYGRHRVVVVKDGQSQVLLSQPGMAVVGTNQIGTRDHLFEARTQSLRRDLGGPVFPRIPRNRFGRLETHTPAREDRVTIGV